MKEEKLFPYIIILIENIRHMLFEKRQLELYNHVQHKFKSLNVLHRAQKAMPSYANLHFLEVSFKKVKKLRDHGPRKIDGRPDRILIPIPQERNGLINWRRVVTVATLPVRCYYHP